MINLLKTILFLLLMIFMGGCFRTNVRVFKKGNIMLIAHIVGLGKQKRIEYYNVQIGRAHNPIDEMPPICIELKNKEIISLQSIDIDKLEQLVLEQLAVKVAVEAESDGRFNWPESTVYNLHRPYKFRVIENKIVGFITLGGPDYMYSGILWNQAKTKRYEFPLDDKDAVELFGKPDEIYDTFQY